MAEPVVEHALQIIARDGPQTTHDIAATFFISGGRFPSFNMGRHHDEVAREKLAADPRLKHYPKTDLWDKA